LSFQAVLQADIFRKECIMSRRLFSILVLGLVFVAPAFPLPDSAESFVGSVDDELVRIGREIPGFGGLFYDEQGRPTLYLLDPQGAGAAALKSLGSEVRLVRGEYEFARLLDWRLELRPLLALPGVVYLDVDEARNRVVLGLDSSSPSKSLDRDRLERELLATSVPRQALLLQDAAPIETLATLQSTFRPVPGGSQILFPISPPTYGVCTLGFNASRGNVFGFVVNSHCTGVRGEVDGIRYLQSVPASGAIGTEVADPAFFTESPCPAGRRCRLSDSAFAKYDKAKQGILGRIARPVAGGSELGSLTVNPAGARFSITGRISSPLAGDVVHKVGRTTGWTYGTVIATCADTNISSSDISLLCQSRVRAGAGGGDSGSPVFYRTGSSTKVKLAGILWGGSTDPQLGPTYVFSPLENIEEELGPLKVN
jgi:hypothetical protein